MPEQAQFKSGMVRSTPEGKLDHRIINYGPMKLRWIIHLDANRENYPDIAPGIPNWTVGDSIEEFDRFLESAERHFDNWAAARRRELTGWSQRGYFLADDQGVGEDEAAAVYFNINGAEHVRLLRKYDGAAAEGYGPGSVLGDVPT